jgi:hypothetical protein
MLNTRNKNNISREFVVAAYRGLLNRDPENEQVIDKHIYSFQTIEDLLRGFIASQEFRFKSLDHMAIVESQYRAKQGNIDITAPENTIQAMFARIAEEWSALGESEPFWSVLSDDRFRTQNIEKTKAEFYAYGRDADRLIDIFCERTHVPSPTGRCLELGLVLAALRAISRSVLLMSRP